MPDAIQGIHHITAIAGDPQRNLDFYTQVMGLRLVKLTVNFDDPGTYHFYFGDEKGLPGTLLTHFPWPNAKQGRRGVGQVSAVGFNIPAGSIHYWIERFKSHGVSTAAPFSRFDEDVLVLHDPDGMQVEMVARADGADGPIWEGGPVPPEHAVRGFASPALMMEGYEKSAQLLTEIFGLTQSDQSGARYRFTAAGSGPVGTRLDIEVRPDEQPGGMGAGIVHHIAFRAKDDAQQLEWRELLVDQGFDVTPVMDRQYFHSIYFREPGGVLYEIATDPPGMGLDETVEALGSRLRMPPWLEPRRGDIEGIVPPLRLPTRERQGPWNK
jgi:glyoxalase family protein